MLEPKDALVRLQDGNQRFVNGEAWASQRSGHENRLQLLNEQRPFAIILGCSDSRVPAELVFDQGLGDLFVVRVAGNIVAPSQIGSVEFAADNFGARLAVVLGHSHCGAVEATLGQLAESPDKQSKNISAIVDRIRPAVEALAADPALKGDDLLEQAVRANVEAAVHELRHGSEIIEQLVASERLLIVGAEYSLATGKVTFFD